ncbi:zinc finger X-chromosomal protein isoform X2 [Microcaecilia unicolor]|uniref:Zinc finger X-chromosomal protein isoform X2 n=1 Tax=Microcaecilia unicolor TaxID=1415580 RepID=A0A6P7XZD7_9AMPH|nr:zinc finger X-chromosomal protein isoform X2 [Microcaecilia unicolor]
MGANGEHIHGAEIVVQETVFVSNVDSDITLHNYVPEDSEPIVIQDVIEDVIIDDAHCSSIMQEGHGSETIIIPEPQVLDTDITEEVSMVHCSVEDILVSDITAEQVLTSEQICVPDMRHIEHMVHNEADIVANALPSEVISEEILVADCSSEAVIDASGISGESLEDEDDCRSSCDDYLMISLDDAEKIEEDSSEITVDADTGYNPCRVDGSCPEVIKVYIFKAESGDDDLGGTVDIVESEAETDPAVELVGQGNSEHMAREKMVYMTVNDCQHDDEGLNVAEIADEVYMEVIVGEEDATVTHQQQIEGNELNKTCIPIAWAAAYGNSADGIESRNGTASALLQIDDSDRLERLAKQKTKKKKRLPNRQYQTGVAAEHQDGNKDSRVVSTITCQ